MKIGFLQREEKLYTVEYMIKDSYDGECYENEKTFFKEEEARAFIEKVENNYDEEILYIYLTIHERVV